MLSTVYIWTLIYLICVYVISVFAVLQLFLCIYNMLYVCDILLTL